MKQSWTCWACGKPFDAGGMLTLTAAHDAKPDVKTQALAVRICGACFIGFGAILRTRRDQLSRR